jgi:hypothetical protein
MVEPGCASGLLTRRTILRVGAVSVGFTLADVLRWRAVAADNGAAASRDAPGPSTSVIFIELAGGPSQFETYDPKPDAPREIRGPFGVVRTRLPGVVFSELMAKQAAVADKLAIVRSVYHDENGHEDSAHYVQTGYYPRERGTSRNEMPSVGSVVAKIRRNEHGELLPFVTIPKMRYGRAAYLGEAYNQFRVTGDPNSSGFEVRGLAPLHDVPRLQARGKLLESLDAVQRLVHGPGGAAFDHFQSLALDLVSNDRARRVFDLRLENNRTRENYGRHRTGQSLLLARRLVEAGVSFVTVRVENWDDHKKLAQSMREKGPAYDQGVAALVEDLHARGLDRDVLVVAIGEFGRTPKINRDAGRDHWGALMSVLFAGGGLRVGQIVGASEPYGEAPSRSRYRPENVLAMIYRHLGIDPARSFTDFTGRPRHLLERRGLVHELI